MAQHEEKIKVINNGPTKKLVDYQSKEKTGFRKRYSTIEHFQTVRTLIEKSVELNVSLHFTFFDYNTAFDYRRPYLRPSITQK